MFMVGNSELGYAFNGQIMLVCDVKDMLRYFALDFKCMLDINITNDVII